MPRLALPLSLATLASLAAIVVAEPSSHASVPSEADYRRVESSEGAPVLAWRTADLAGSELNQPLLPFLACPLQHEDTIVLLSREAGAAEILVVRGPNARCRGFVPMAALTPSPAE